VPPHLRPFRRWLPGRCAAAGRRTLRRLAAVVPCAVLPPARADVYLLPDCYLAGMRPAAAAGPLAADRLPDATAHGGQPGTVRSPLV
jgi:hypothetical protein